MAIKVLCVQEYPVKQSYYVILYVIMCLPACALERDKEAKQKGQGGCVSASEFEALLLPYIAAQITNLGAVIPASRCYFNPTFEANRPVMLLLTANEGSDGR